MLGSDHAPHTLEEKAKPYPASPSGMTGVQTLVPLMLDHVNAGRLSLARFVDLTSAGPARLFGIACKGRIAAGYDADFTVVDLKRSETITDKWIASRAGWTPYDGVAVTGWPVGTFVRGRRVMWEGESGHAVDRRAGAVSGDVVGENAPLYKRRRVILKRLLPRAVEREFAVADALAETFGEFGGRFLAIGADEFGERGEQAGLRQAIAVDAVEARFGPGFLQIAERHVLLFVIGNGSRAVGRTASVVVIVFQLRAPASKTAAVPSELNVSTGVRDAHRSQ